MRLTRVYVEAAPRVGERLLIRGNAASYVTRVLRLKVGDALTVFDGRGSEFAVRIEGLRRDAVAVTVLEQRQLDRESPLRLTLAQGLSRSERMDWVIQKATELGVARIIPVLTEHSVVRLDGAQARRKLQHWRAVAVAACEQCGRNRIPEITAPFELAALGDALEAGTLRLLLSPVGALRLADLKGGDAAITVLIGPEGGLAAAEEQLAVACRFQPVRLGPRILRTETAALAALAILQRQFGDL